MNYLGPEPWQGDEYRRHTDDIRVLIVGESHYNDVADDNGITQRVVEQRKNNLEYNNFFGIIEQIVLGHKPNIAAVYKFWDKFAFLNYAPLAVTDGISSDPSHFRGAAKRLQSFVLDTEPDLICFFSVKAWQSRPWGGPDWTEEVFGAEPRDLSPSVTLYPFKQRALLMARFNHPRRLGSPMDVWHEWYKYVHALATQAKGGVLR